MLACCGRSGAVHVLHATWSSDDSSDAVVASSRVSWQCRAWSCQLCWWRRTGTHEARPHRLLQVGLPPALAAVSRLEPAPDGRHVAVAASSGAWAVLRAGADGGCELLAVEPG
jgi:hypothetical protein